MAPGTKNAGASGHRRGPDQAGALADASERAAAVTEFGRTVVVTAGAGTGKTALLVERALNVLMRPGRPVPVTDILGLTFSNRAAGEMRVRIREALESFAEWSLATGGPPESGGHVGSIYRGMLARTRLSRREIRERATSALASLERASISTMHAFAARVLRRHPVEAGVDPHFREDDGLSFTELFEAEWERFLETELSERAPRAELWNDVLDEISLTDLTELARRLCDEGVPLETIARRLDDGSLFETDHAWLESRAREAKEILAAHEDGASQNAGKLLRAGLELLEGLLAGKAPADLAGLDEALRTGPGVTKKWDAAAVARVKALGRIARDLLHCRSQPVKGALELLLVFAEDFRAKFVRTGNMSFSALLVRARDLLRDHPRVREDLKRRYRHVLVDEFQDTDPLQYEIVFYLAEREGSCAREWHGCELEPGKLFIVGDPKQSIYHFRGADIGAYHQVVGERLAGEAVPLSLRTSFRSNDRVISAVNGVFRSLIREEPGVQPAYEPLEVRPGGEANHRSQRVDFLLTRPPGGGRFRYAADASEGEARALARWIGNDLVGEGEIPDAEGGTRPVRAGDVAILLRKMTNVGCYTEALDAEGLPYVVEGEKSFYVTQEITDFLNLLGSLCDPHDRTALVGVLRSGLGALTDADIARLAEAGRLDYMCEGPLPDSLGDREGAEKLYAAMRQLHSEVTRLPVARAVDALTERLPVIEAAIASGSGERGRANLRKIRRQAREYGSRPEITTREFVSLVRKRVEGLREEGESPLAEQDADAVRILTIHKAKGLEFPVVIVPGLHAGARPQEERVWVRLEWGPGAGPHDQKERPAGAGPHDQKERPAGAVGLRIGDAWTPAAVRLAAREVELDEAEERRVFYVAATRARDRLVFSAARVERSPGGPLSYLTEAAGLPLDSDEPAVIALNTPVAQRDDDCGGLSARGRRSARPQGATCGRRSARPEGATCGHLSARQAGAQAGGEIHFTPLDAPEAAGARPAGERQKLPPEHVESWAAGWARRERRLAMAKARRVFASPSFFTEAEDAAVEAAAEEMRRADETPEEKRAPSPVPEGLEDLSARQAGAKVVGLLVGVTAHRALELLDFGSPGAEAQVDELIAREVARLRPQARERREQIQREVGAILSKFLDSDVFADLRRAKVLARELPCIFPWDVESGEAADPHRAAAEGVIDLVCELDDRLLVVDYKTSRIDASEAHARAQGFRKQGEMYARAVTLATGRHVDGFRVLFLRPCVAVDVDVG